VPVDAPTKVLCLAVDTQQLVRTRPHDTALSQIPVLSHACKEEEIVAGMILVTVIMAVEVVLSSNQQDPTLPVVAVTKDFGRAEERWYHALIKIPITAEARINLSRVAWKVMVIVVLIKIIVIVATEVEGVSLLNHLRLEPPANVKM